MEKQGRQGGILRWYALQKEVVKLYLAPLSKTMDKPLEEIKRCAKEGYYSQENRKQFLSNLYAVIWLFIPLCNGA